jgi:hypothetical protein
MRLRPSTHAGLAIMETASSFSCHKYAARLALAARLSEDQTITVGILEAGRDRSGDPKILTPGLE